MPTSHIHPGDPPYAPPLLRAASPSSSIGTDYGPDQTSASDAQMTAEQFNLVCEQKLLLHMPGPDEQEALVDPLLQRPKNPRDMKILHERIMKNLRYQVKKLEEDEVFERTDLQTLQVVDDEPSSSNDIDAILQSMMGNIPQPSSPQDSIPRSVSPPIPEINGHNRLFPGATTEGESERQSNGPTPVRRTTRSTTKARRG